MDDIEDPSNLTGISNIVNKRYTDTKLDLNAIEKSIIGTTGVRVMPESDPAQEFRNTIKELTADTGISIETSTIASGSVKPTRSIKPAQSVKPARSVRGRPRLRGKPVNRPRSPTPSTPSESEEESGTESGSGYTYGSGSGYTYGSGSESGSQSSYDDRDYRDRDHGHNGDHHRTRSRHEGHRPVVRKELNQRYYDRLRGRNPDHRDTLADAIKMYSGSKDVTLEEENQEEIKAELLEDIDELKHELEQDGVDISRVQEVNKDSRMETVRSIHKMLRMKYDRKRCNSLGTELIMACAQGLGYLFDGKRKWGPYCPDLTGWHNTIRPKLRRMKYETSSVIADVMHQYNIGPMTRVGLELVPSAVLYSRLRRDQHGRSNYTPNQISNAFEDLRQFDT